VLFIHDIGDGGSKTDKFARDIGLLKELDECPDNDRYLFYLANSYKDYGKYDAARITNPGSAWAVGRRRCGCATTTSGTAINY
jgi:hypothetical protein